MDHASNISSKDPLFSNGISNIPIDSPAQPGAHTQLRDLIHAFQLVGAGTEERITSPYEPSKGWSFFGPVSLTHKMHMSK
jgi:hypothetical protein